MAWKTATLPDEHVWWRVGKPSWDSPLNTRFSREYGGRWNPPQGFDTLYLNWDLSTAVANAHRVLEVETDIDPEKLLPGAWPVFYPIRLPPSQRVCDVRDDAGLRLVGLPTTYPVDAQGILIGHTRCRIIGQQIRDAGLKGIWTRSAQVASGEGHEVAWFPHAGDVARSEPYLSIDEARERIAQAAGDADDGRRGRSRRH